MPWSNSSRNKSHEPRMMNCKKCGEKFETRSHNSKWCKDCAEIKKLEYKATTRSKMNIRYTKGKWMCATCGDRKDKREFKTKYRKCNDCRERS